MAVQMFLSIDGVPGDSTDYNHRGWSEILSWRWDMVSNRIPHQEGADQTRLNELSVIKMMGADSASIRELFARGVRIPRVILDISPVMERRQLQKKYVNLVMEDVQIQSVTSAGSVENTYFEEHISFLFERVRFDFHANPLPKPGSAPEPSGGTVIYHFAWDVAANDAWAAPPAVD